MSNLQYFSMQAVRELWDNVPNNLDLYFSSTSHPFQERGGDTRDSRISKPDLSELEDSIASTPSLDRANAQVVYRELKDLTPHQASDQRLWTYLCHRTCPTYVSRRWLKERPSNDAAAVRKVQSHFFANSNRVLIRDNGLSRLWWLGKIASDVAPESPDGFLSMVLHRQDISSSLVGRPTVTSNTRVLRVIYNEMLIHWKDDDNRQLFERYTFRRWMRSLNRKGGICLLDAMPDDALSDLVRAEAHSALASDTD